MEHKTLQGKHILQCNKCKHTWLTVYKKKPKRCPKEKCRSKEWNNKKGKKR